MSDGLVVNTAALHAAGASVRAEAGQVEGVGAWDARAAVGDPGLAASLERFSAAWDGRRVTLVESVEALASACAGIGEGLESVDHMLVCTPEGST